jgi:hypothetical protein
MEGGCGGKVLRCGAGDRHQQIRGSWDSIPDRHQHQQTVYASFLGKRPGVRTQNTAVGFDQRPRPFVRSSRPCSSLRSPVFPLRPPWCILGPPCAFRSPCYPSRPPRASSAPPGVSWIPRVPLPPGPIPDLPLDLSAPPCLLCLPGSLVSLWSFSSVAVVWCLV